MKINENDKVLIASDDAPFAPYKGKVATVKRIYTEVNPLVAYVKVEVDPTIADLVGFKVPLADLVLIPDEHKPEIPEGAREITKGDFVKTIIEVTSPDRMFTNEDIDPAKIYLAGISAMTVGKNAENEIFRDSDSVVMDEDQFIAALWNACNPVTVAETTGERMSVYECADVALAAFATLKNIVPILFGEVK